MLRIAGVDGCRGGWLLIGKERNGELEPMIVDTSELFVMIPAFSVVAIDIPIGLPDNGPREVDGFARRLLGSPRASSVFATPVRAALDADCYRDACARSEAACGSRLSKQGYAILPKIREVDELLRRSPALIGRIREVHPEVSFYFLNGGRPMLHGKKCAAGRTERVELLQNHFGSAFERLRDVLPRSVVAADDIADALVALWSAERVAATKHETLRGPTAHDRFGLPMEMVA